MTSSGAQRYYWCLSHARVETAANLCAAVKRLGPYATAAEAERALDRVRERNEAWDAEDARWTEISRAGAAAGGAASEEKSA